MRRAPGLVFALLGALGCRGEDAERESPRPTPVACMAAGPEDVDVTVVLRGRVASPPGGDLPVASQVAGRVREVLVHEGDRVEAGAIVATIDDGATRDASRQAEAAQAQARSGAANAEATLARTRELVARGIAPKQELDDALARADQARAGVQSANAVADQAHRTLHRIEVRSSFAGTVTRVWRGAGALVDGSAATPIVELASAAAPELDADATERELVGVHPGQPAEIRLGTGEALRGTVRGRSAALDPATGLGLVRIDLEGDAPALLGAFGTATIHVERRPGVLVIPSRALRGAVADGAEVVVCHDRRAEVRPVRTGWRDEGRVEVVAGLAAGDRVAVDHVLGLETGAPIAETSAPSRAGEGGP